MNDTELVQGFTERGSESAFRALVERHLALVLGTARRITGNSSLAEEVAQAVFILLARKARSLGSQTILAGWLYRTTCFVAARAWRTEQRRRGREQEAVAMQIQTDSDPLWQQITPQLDDALGRLGNDDRNALVLRFFEQCSLREVGTATGTSEEAAKKRVNRALDKLRRLLSRRGPCLRRRTPWGTCRFRSEPSQSSHNSFSERISRRPGETSHPKILACMGTMNRLRQ